MPPHRGLDGVTLGKDSCKAARPMKAMMEDIPRGLPKLIRSDNGKEFRSNANRRKQEAT